MSIFFRRIIDMTDKILLRHQDIEELLDAPEVLADGRMFRRLARERQELYDIVKKRRSLDKALAEKKDCEAQLDAACDGELEGLLRDELDRLDKDIQELTGDINVLLILRDGAVDKNAILEIKYIEGGESGQRLALMLLDMYRNYARRSRLDFCVNDAKSPSAYLLDSAAFWVKGAYDKLKHESGLHKAVEGRMSATVFVAVYPELDEIDDSLLQKDIRVDVFHSGGAGGQNVNKVETAVRITHVPSGIVVVCQDERSQLKNKQRAIKNLKAKLSSYYKKQQEQVYQEDKKRQVENKEIVRIYDTNDEKVTDPKTQIELALKNVINGDINNFLDARSLF